MSDKKWAKGLCRRFILFLEDSVGLNLKDAAAKLDYTDVSTLEAIKAGRSFPGMEKIRLAAMKLRDSSGRRLDINWLFTGQGNPLMAVPTLGASPLHFQDIIRFSALLSESQRASLANLLNNPVPAGGHGAKPGAPA